MKDTWSKYKTEIVAAIIGALFSGVVSLSVGLYSITRSFEYLQNKELLQQLRVDITLLKSVESELDLNLQSLLSEPVSIAIETEKIGSWRDIVEDEPKKKGEKQVKEEALRMVDAMMGGDVYRVTKAELPRLQFYAEAWPTGGPGVSEIDFALVQQISELYRDLRRLNKFIESVANIGPGTALTQRSAESLQLQASTNNSLVTRISRESILGVKNRVSEEIHRLNDRRQRLAG